MNAPRIATVLAVALALSGCALIRIPVNLSAKAVTGAVKVVTPDMSDMD